MNEGLKTSTAAAGVAGASRSWKWMREMEREIGARWAAAGKSLDAFPGICRQCLAAAAVETDRPVFLRRLLGLDYPRRQAYPDGEFGDVAVTVARNEDFRIDVYLWNGGTDTSIHDHHFAGAYRPVFGASRQHRFVFEPGRDDGPGLTGGVLRHCETRSIGRGEAVEIPVGSRLIHMVEHLGEPTVTICVRTDDLDGRHLDGYWFPGYRCADGASLPARTRTRLNLLFALGASGRADWTALIRPFLRSLSARELFLLVVAGRRLLPPASDAARDAFNGALRACVRQHPDWLMVPPVHHRRIERLLSPTRPAS